MNRKAVAVAVAIMAGSFLLSRRAYAMTDSAAQDTSYAPRESDFNPTINLPVLPPIWQAAEAENLPSDYTGEVYISNEVWDWPTEWPTEWDEIWNWPIDEATQTPLPYVPFEDGFPVAQLPAPPSMTSQLDQQVFALLYMVRCCEHLYPQNVTNGACYGIFYAGQSNFAPAAPFLNQTFFDDYRDHPAITKACVPVPLSPDVCRAAGLKPGCVSSAAGAYQIIRPTWEGLKRAHPELTNFGQQAQDLAAYYLLEECGALTSLRAGDWPEAVKKASKVWASLPGSTARQSPKDRAFALERFNEGLALA